MNVLFDLGAIKTGGGVQLAVNFLSLLDRQKENNINIFLVIPEIGELSNLSLRGKYSGVFVSPNSFIKRFFFEYGHLQYLIRRHKIQHIFTFFGSGLPHSKSVRSVVTVAYPIICYPESDYWNYAGMKEQAYIRCLNILRRSRLKKASSIIAETTVMQARLARSVKYPMEKICVIPPAPSQYVEPLLVRRRVPSRRFLFISGINSHKNLWRLPAIAECMLARGIEEFVFVLTCTRESYVKSLKKAIISEELIDTHFTFLGSIPPQRIMEAYNQADIVVSLSDLESFSNNYMEAWAVRLPLVVSDRDFARNICADSALYVDPHRPKDVAEQLILISEDLYLQDRLVKAGEERLSFLLSPQKRFSRIMTELLGNEEELDNNIRLRHT
ncbi:MAG: glycosyltransferase [Nitrospira sp.]|nr:glycosyltransferase [Nitrospira sp.]